MELVGSIASIVAVGQAADAALRLSRKMFKTAREIQGAREDIEEIAQKIENFESIIGAAHFTLHRRYKGQTTFSPLMIYMDKRNTLGKMADASYKVLGRIKILRGRIQSVQSRLTIFSKLKWIMRKSEVEALGPEMECVKTSMQIVLSLVQLDVAYSEDPSPELRKQIKRLKRTIDEQARQLAVQKREITRQSLRIWDDREPALDDSDLDFQEDLISVCETMVLTGTVPGQISPSQSSTVSRSTSLYSDESWPESARVVFDGPQPNSQGIHPSGVPQQHRTDSATTTFLHQQVQDRPDHEHTTTQTPWNYERTVRYTRQGFQTIVLAVPPTQEPAPILREEYTAVHPIEVETQLSQESQPTGLIISGVMATQYKRRRIQAGLNPNISQNIMSARFATRFGLKIDPLEDSLQVDVGDGNTFNPCGQVNFQWGQGGKPTFTVWCYVFLEGVKSLTFGKPFVAKRASIWPDWQDDDDIDEDRSE